MFHGLVASCPRCIFLCVIVFFIEPALFTLELSLSVMMLLSKQPLNLEALANRGFA